MKHAAVGCLTGLLGWLALATLLSWQLQLRLQLPALDTLGVSALAGLLGWAALNLLHASFRAWRERSAVAAGSQATPPSDGRRAVLVGTIEPLGEVLHAPLDGSPCVAYDYRITEDRGSGRRRTVFTHFRGSGLVPSVIVTRSGRHRLLTVPDLQGSAPATTPGAQIAAFERHARTLMRTPPAEAAQELVNRWTDDGGAYRSDVCYTPLSEVDLGRCQLAQQHIRPGAPVCAIGTWSAERGGLVPSPAWGDNPRLIEGGVDDLLQTLGASAWQRLVLAGLAAAGCAGLVAAFMQHAIGE